MANFLIWLTLIFVSFILIRLCNEKIRNWKFYLILGVLVLIIKEVMAYLYHIPRPFDDVNITIITIFNWALEGVYLSCFAYAGYWVRCNEK